MATVAGAGMANKRVCPSCAKGATLLVLAGKATCACGAPATSCAGCSSKAEAKAKTAFEPKKVAKALKLRAVAYKAAVKRPHQKVQREAIDLLNTASDLNETDALVDGVVQGLEMAAAFIESGRW